MQILRKLGIEKIEDLGLDFTIPGYEIELKLGGYNIPVTSENIEEYIEEVIDSITGRGVKLQAKPFSEGLSKVFQIADLQIFTPDELIMLFRNALQHFIIYYFCVTSDTDTQ